MGLFDGLFGGGSDVQMPTPDQYLPLVEAQANVNRLNTYTPFGQTVYTKDGPKPMGYDDWLANNPAPAPTSPSSRYEELTGRAMGTMSNRDPAALYEKYVSDFNKSNPQQTSVTQSFTPEIQGLFDKQFNPGAYDDYSGDYMDRYYQLVGPDRDYAMDRFEQNMFNRGQPVGGEEYGAKYRQTIGDPQSRQDIMAADAAAKFAEQAKLSDFNRLMAAMGGSSVPVPQVDVSGPANMALNANISNAQNQSSIWDTLPQLASAYMIGAPADSWLWS